MRLRLGLACFMIMACALGIVACGDDGPDSSEVVKRFGTRREAGAGCAELYDIRDEVLDSDPVMAREMLEGLQRIGCDRPGSERTDLVSTTATPAGVGSSACTDPAGDGIGGDLLQASLTTQGDELLVTWETAAPLVGARTIGYFVNISPYQIGLRQIDGEIVKFVFDFTTNDQVNLTRPHTIDGTSASLQLPTSALSKLEASSDYQAVITADGEDLDDCEGTLAR